jgi:hypothetical protein
MDVLRKECIDEEIDSCFLFISVSLISSNLFENTNRSLSFSES